MISTRDRKHRYAFRFDFSHPRNEPCFSAPHRDTLSTDRLLIWEGRRTFVYVSSPPFRAIGTVELEFLLLQKTCITHDHPHPDSIACHFDKSYQEHAQEMHPASVLLIKDTLFVYVCSPTFPSNWDRRTGIPTPSRGMYYSRSFAF